MSMHILLLIIPLAVLYIFLRRAGIRRVGYRRYFSEAGVFEGDTLYLVEEVSNPFFLPLVMVDVDVNLPPELCLAGYASGAGMQQFTSRFYLPPFTQVKRSVEVACAKRGLYRLESVNIAGVMRSAIAEVYVYPQALPYGANNPMDNDVQNTKKTERRLFQDPFSFSGIRDYQSGDAFRAINYKATAKTGTFKVNNRDYFSNRNVMLYIDFGQVYPHSLTTDEYTTLMECALSYSADMVWDSIRQGFSVGFAANCRAIGRSNHVRYPMGRGHSHYMEILKEMAVIRMLEGCSFLWLLRQDLDTLHNMDIYIMTTNATLELDEVTEIFRSRGNSISIVMLE